MKTYIYHFHAMKQEGNIIHNQDGIVEWKVPITEWSQYQETKATLCANFPELGTDPNKFILDSLSFLHTKGEDDGNGA